MLWPAWIPLAVLLMEAPGRRHRVLLTWWARVRQQAPICFMCWRLSGSLAAYRSAYWIPAPHFFAAEVMNLYLLATTVSPLVSTYGVVKVFGALALLSFGAAYYFYTTWFISVWCFFAALLSAVIYVHFPPGCAGDVTVNPPGKTGRPIS